MVPYKFSSLFGRRLRLRFTVALLVGLGFTSTSLAQPIEVGGTRVTLSVTEASTRCVRITLDPTGGETTSLEDPVLPARAYPAPVIRVDDTSQNALATVGGLKIQVTGGPLAVRVERGDGTLVQVITFQPSGGFTFALDDHPVLGLGEGGPRDRGDWRTTPVEFDRRGRLHRMQPRWQAGHYGSRNPVPLAIGAGGWAFYAATPWGEFDLRDKVQGKFLPLSPEAADITPQDFDDQTQQRGKGIPPAAALASGRVELFVFDAADPVQFFDDLADLSGRAVMPPKWALGYMQSHRTLEDDAQLVRIVDTFREKQIPVDAVIYLGTGFTPRGWNTHQPSFEFNPEVFKRDPRQVIADLHDRHVKVIVHMVPWARDRLPTLRGEIPPAADAQVTPGHLADYWPQHTDLVAAGVDAWWPDEGDWFDLYERMKRHQLYYQGPLSTTPNRRPWSLHRNGHLGVARWGGWVWSGDTNSAWKTLETQIAVGVNHSLSLSPYWGSDIGGFYPTRELTGELYARWFQFAAFCPSFRSHGRTWWTRLPWGWGLSEMGPIEGPEPPYESELNNNAIEPIAKKYAELRYQLLTYNYSLAWQARDAGLPLMRALWIHYPQDVVACGTADEYLWGRDLLVAPVYEKGATTRDVYLPPGRWYDWWTSEPVDGGTTIKRKVDLATMPIYVRGGAIVPIDPIRQYTAEPVDEPVTLRIYPGGDGDITLYDDDGESLDYLRGQATLTHVTWDDSEQQLRIARRNLDPSADAPRAVEFKVQLMPAGPTTTVEVAEQASWNPTDD